MNDGVIRSGIDIGSTTVKVIALDGSGEPTFKSYTRHFSEVRETVARCLGELATSGVVADETPVAVVVTGSGGVGVAEILGLPFVQEVIACARAIEER
ncbi:MAG: hypothetical protein LBS70_00870, partial [Candidatus Accumulibacter sp.]|nr:hypothetical protein [Accumulibacter sp.]